MAEVKRAWVYYQYAYNMFALYDKQSELVDQLQKTARLRYEQGDITLSERNMINSMAADLHTRFLQAEEELAASKRRFTWTCYSDNSILPADKNLNILPVVMNANSVSSVYSGYFENLTKEKSAMLSIERSRFFPEISLGYVRQKIAPLTGLNSWMAGVSFPILFFSQRSRVKQAKIETYITQTENNDRLRQLRNKLTELESMIRKQSESVQYFAKAALPEADALQESALVQFRESEIDITQFVQSLNTVRDIKRNYIDAVYNYNITLLEIEMYSESK